MVRKQSLGQGYVFTPVCHCVNRVVQVQAQRGVQTPTPQQIVTAADGTHPTGMHCCFSHNVIFNK